jgi:hypothetical protein
MTSPILEVESDIGKMFAILSISLIICQYNIELGSMALVFLMFTNYFVGVKQTRGRRVHIRAY